LNKPAPCEVCGWTVINEATVTIPLEEYRALQQRPAQRNRSPIARDPQLSAFIIRSSRTMTIHQLHDACVSRFGADRAPSRSAIGRFLQRRSTGLQQP